MKASPRRAYQETFIFGGHLKMARDAARAGNCKSAKSHFKEATRLGHHLSIELPNARGEITRKIAMVENTLLSHSCKARHFGTSKRRSR